MPFGVHGLVVAIHDLGAGAVSAVLDRGRVTHLRACRLLCPRLSCATSDDDRDHSMPYGVCGLLDADNDLGSSAVAYLLDSCSHPDRCAYGSLHLSVREA